MCCLCCWIGFDPDTSTSIYHITNIHNNENTGQIALQRVRQNATPSAKNGNIFRFWHDAALVFSRRSSLAAMLDSPLPTRRQGDIRLPSQAASDRDLRSVSRSRAVRLLRRLPLTKPDALSYPWQVGVLAVGSPATRFSRPEG